MVTKTRTPLGQRLWEHRQELGLSQEQAAVQLGTTGYSYGQWESGKDVPKNTKWFAALALWLGTNREEIALLVVESTDDDGRPTAATIPAATIRGSSADDRPGVAPFPAAGGAAVTGDLSQAAAA